MHPVTIMNLKAKGLQLSVDTVLTSRQIRQFSPNFSRTIRSEAIEKWEGKDLFSPLCIEIWRGIRPPCPTARSTPDSHNAGCWMVIVASNCSRTGVERRQNRM